jgi:hypothetical protein
MSRRSRIPNADFGATTSPVLLLKTTSTYARLQGLQMLTRVLPFLFLAACALDSEPTPQTSTTDQDLTGSEIDSSWFSDAAFKHQVGESDLYCTAGKFQEGTIGTKYVVRFTWPCQGAGGSHASCQEYVPAQFGESASYQTVDCPAGLF